ncbi:MAG: hypothetical protein IPL46_33125 [Saprospiraceae bacterium]|nr:hypothetical protein [Saprospiraceae bacterium]
MNQQANTAVLVAILTLVFLITCKTIPIVSNDQSLNPSYSEMWQKVDSLEKSGLPKSGLSVVREIKRIAVQNGDGIEQIKSIIYENKYILELEDLSLDTIIDNMEQELRLLESPAKEILHSYIAELYVLYLQQNAHILQDRKTQQTRPERIDLMSGQDLMVLADEHYKNSIANVDLNNLTIDNIQSLLNPNDGDSASTPTLFELVVLRSLDHFENTFYNVPVGQQIYSLKGDQFFLPRAEFIQLKLDDRDTADHRFQAIRIFQEALSILHNPVTLDLRRLAYVFENSNIDNKEELYKDAIIYLINNSIDSNSKSESSHHLASLYFQLDFLSKAHTTCKNTIQSFPNTDGAIRCQSLLQQIEMPSMQIQVEKTGIPGQSQLVNLSYKNLDQIHYRLVEVSESEKDQFFELPYEQQLPFLLERHTVAVDEVQLKDSADFKLHSTEFMIRPLPKGSYFLLVSSSEQFDAAQDAISVNTVYISNLAFSSSHFGGVSEMICFNRTSGIPLVDVTVHWYQQSYDRLKGRQVKTKIGDSKSDENGAVRAPEAKGNFLPVLTLTDDTLNLQDFYFNNYGSGSNPGSSDEVSFFLDRSIYRPGQIVHFKGIVVRRNANGEPTIRSNQVVKVVLYNTNGQEVSNQSRITNPFGSFNGSFVLPESGLLGQMSIGTDITYQRQSFQVEAYKRPSFKIDFDTLAAAKLGDLLTVRGEVLSYAGAPLGNVAVSYRVVRKARYPFYSMYSRFPHPPQSEREITSGVLRTEKDGGFRFDFTAPVDDQVGQQSNPVFDFEIMVTAVDVSGESQSGREVLSLGMQPFGIQMVTPDLLDITVDHQLKFKALTTEGHFIPVAGKLIFKKFQSVVPWHRDRYWGMPDLPILEDQDYKQSFIWYDSPDNTEPQLETRELQEMEGAMQGEHFVVDFKDLSLPASRYQIALSVQDSEGHQIDSEFEIELVDSDSTYVPSNKMLYILSSHLTYEPGETCILKVASPFSGSLFWRIERMNELGPGQWQSFNGWREIEIPIEESDRGGLFVHFQLAFENRFFNESVALDVPWTNKQLDFKVLTLRDVTKPGTRENVELQITRPVGSSMKSEIVASMFDASLDVLFPHAWNLDLYRKKYSQFNQYGAGFDIAHGNLYADGWHPDPILLRPIYTPSLNWFGFPFYRRLPRSMESMQSKVLRSDAAAVPQDMVTEDAMQTTEQRSVSPHAIREHFNENLFFYPELVTDQEGHFTLEYEMNDALTTWRLMLMAHDQELASGYQEFKIVSRKELMITTNRPRFLRAGDELVFSAKIDNLTAENIPTKVRLNLSNALTGQSLNDLLMISDISFDIDIDAKASAAAQWKLIIPDTFHFPIEYTVYADGLKHNDAERAVIPVLENRILVTATRAFEVKGLSTEEFALDGLISQGSDVAKADRLVLDFTSNPTWYAIKALPYLMDYPYECSEQIFNRFFANSLGIKLITDNPSIERVFKQWKGSNLQCSLLNDQD